MLSCASRSEEHTSELQSLTNIVCRLLLEKKKSDRLRQSWSRVTLLERSAGGPIAPMPGPKVHARVGRMLPEDTVSDLRVLVFFFNDTATTEIYTLSLHDALPIWGAAWGIPSVPRPGGAVTPRSVR